MMPLSRAQLRDRTDTCPPGRACGVDIDCRELQSPTGRCLRSAMSAVLASGVASRRCPKCGLLNRATAERCDCGRSFVDGSQGTTLGDRLARGRSGDRDEFRRNCDRAVRRARNWILGVGIPMFVFDQLAVQVAYGDYISAEWKLKLLLIDSVVLSMFIAMYIVARTRPLAACIAALCVFWGLQLALAVIDPASLFHGILIKVGFTLALIAGIRSAARADRLLHELAEVFE